MRLAAFWSTLNVARVISALLAAGILEMRGVHGRPGWCKFSSPCTKICDLSLLQSSLPRRYVEHSLYEGTVFSSLEVYPKRAQRTLRLDGSDSILETTVHFYSY